MSEKTVERIQQILREKNLPFQILEHKPVFTSEEAARERGNPLHEGVKALLLKNENGIFVMALLAADKKVDLKKLEKMVGFKELNLANKDDVVKMTDCEIGAVPPFGFEKALGTYIDESVFDHEWCEFNIGIHTKSIRMKAGDLRKILLQKLLDFAK